MKRLNRDDSLISASEIGQFTFCSVYWFHKRKGVKPSSFQKISHGMYIHNKLGKRTHRAFWLIRLSITLFIFGIGLLILFFLFTYFEIMG